MLFQSQEFALVFLPLTLLAFYAVVRDAWWRNTVLIVASLIFYAWWDPRFLPLFVGYCALAWGAARLYVRTKRPAAIIAGIALMLLGLGLFKYLTFALDTLLAPLGLPPPRWSIVLPIGISFFTFQLVSYLVDVRRGEAPAHSLRIILLYIAFFPHLIAGPIVRHHELIPQFALDPLRAGFHERFAKGLVLFVLGLAKKVFLADHLAPLADPAFAVGGAPDAALAWTGVLAFTFQLFLDFSAYSEMAIGLALLFGFDLPENFATPYRARTLQDFWRRWHITLSSFFRDYVYIPLGGSRRGPARASVNLMLTMALCGLWHGAGFTYILWGLWHGVGLVAHRLWQGVKVPLPGALGWLLTFLFVALGWVLFRAPNLADAGAVYAGLFGFSGLGSVQPAALALIGVSALVSIGLPSSHRFAERWIFPSPIYAAATAALLFLCVLEVGQGAPAAFIYFQF